jgi:predicted TIM-barrel fold metal-dependent hydrolase
MPLEPHSRHDRQYARSLGSVVKRGIPVHDIVSFLNFSLLDVVAELNIPVIYYPDRNEYPGPARAYYMIATAYPSVKFILPHLGAYRSWHWWAHYEAMDLVKRFPNIYVGTSSVISRKYLEMAARELPAQRILFGSFAPELDPRVELYSVRLLKLSEPSQALILGGNMQNLLGLSGLP